MKKEKIYEAPQVETLQLVPEQVFATSLIFENEDYDLTEEVEYYEYN